MTHMSGTWYSSNPCNITNPHDWKEQHFKGDMKHVWNIWHSFFHFQFLCYCSEISAAYSLSNRTSLCCIILSVISKYKSWIAKPTLVMFSRARLRWAGIYRNLANHERTNPPSFSGTFSTGLKYFRSRQSNTTYLSGKLTSVSSLSR